MSKKSVLRTGVDALACGMGADYKLYFLIFIVKYVLPFKKLDSRAKLENDVAH